MGLSTLKLGTTLVFDYYTCNISGVTMDADQLPAFWVYKGAETTGVVDGLVQKPMQFRTTFPGSYIGIVDITTTNGFVVGEYYNVVVSGRVEGRTTYTAPHTFYLEGTSFDDYALAGSSIYTANIHYVVDDINNQDEYTVLWSKNDAPVTGYPAATIQVMKRDGTDLIPPTGMSSVGASTAVKFDAVNPLQRTLDGEAYIVITSIDYDGATRTWRKIVGNDVNTA